ncbi:hypothetical protein RCS94_06975 [Orbaceae bacterium ac157xtp]
MNRFLLFIFLFFSFQAIATSDMCGITRHAYLDNDDIEDKIVCGYSYPTNKERSSFAYECQIITQSITVSWMVIDNDDCSEYNIASKVKGEFIVSCGIWGQNTDYFYKFDENLKNWFLYRTEDRILPMYGDKPVPDMKIEEPKKQWSIDKKKFKIVK